MLDHHPKLPGSSEQLDQVFHALAHPVRRDILVRIGERARSISELSEPFDMTLEAVSQHVRVLERAGLLTRTKRGRSHECRLDAGPLRGAAEVVTYLARFWGDRFDALDRYLKEPRSSGAE